MPLCRSIISLLCALAALLGLPAVALAETNAPVNTTPVTPVAWQTAPYAVALSGTDSESGLDKMQWKLDGSIETDAVNGETITIPASGVYILETRAVDLDGNFSLWRVETLRIDLNLPTDTTNSGTLAWRPTATSVTVTAADPTSGVGHLEWQLDAGSVQIAPNGTSVPIAGDGAHVLRTWAVDVAGNISPWTDHTVKVDTVTPTDVTAAPAGWQTGPLPVTVAGADAHSGVASVSWTVDGGATGSGPSGSTVTVSGDGDHILQTRITDNVGHQSGWKSHTIRIDSTAPANQTPAASSAWRATSYAVMVSGADNGSGLAQVEWRVDGGPVTPGGSPLQATVSGTGTHTLETRAVDVAGNASGWRSESVRIDSVLPTNTTTAPSGAVANPYVVSVTGTDALSGVGYVEWRIDGGAPQSGPSAAQATVTGNGAHLLETRVVDLAGNATGWRSDNVQIDIALNNDLTDPADTSQTAPAGWRTDPVTLTISATDGGSGMDVVQWRIDGLQIQTRSGASASLTISDDGVHELETRGRDLAGNESPWRLQTIRIDTTVPTDTTAIPTEWQRSRNFTLSATDAPSDIDEIQYRINGVDFPPATNGQSIDVGADGAFTISHRAIDLAGQASAWKTDTLRVDTVLPVNTSAVPASTWRPGALVQALSGFDAASDLSLMQWRVAGGAIHDGGPAVVDEDGVQTLETRAVDVAGNVSLWRSDTVRVDTTAPVNDTPEPASGWRATPYTVTVAGSDTAGSGVAGIERTVDGGPVSVAPAVTISGDGVHLLRTRIIDAVGNASAWRTDTISIDTTVPVNDTPVPPSGWRATDYTVHVAGSDIAGSGVAGIERTVDGGAVSVDPDVTITGDGVHLLRTRIIDAVGNGSAWRTDTISIDTTAPINDTPVPASGWRASDYTVRVEGSELTGSGVAGIERTVDGGDISVDPDVTITGDGVHELRTRIVDVVGNKSAWRTDTISIDTTVPVNDTPEPASGWRATDYTVHVEGSDIAGSGVAGIERTVDADAVSVDPEVTITGDGVHELLTRIIDTVGNASEWRTDTIKIDSVAPLVGLVCSPASGWSSLAVTCTASANGGPSGLSSLTASQDGGADSAIADGGAVVVSADGAHVVRLAATDGAGNTASTEATVHVDRTVPTATVTCAADSGTAYACQASGADATSGVAALDYRLNGGAWMPVAAGASFAIAKGAVQVRAVDGAGNEALTGAVTLVDRVKIAKPPLLTSSSVPVHLAGHTDSKSLVGAMKATRSPTGAVSVDLRPLAVGRGNFRVEIKIRSGKRSTKVKRTVKVGKGGHLPRISGSLASAIDKCTVTLTVRKRVGHKWRRFATAKAVLAG